MNTMSMLRRGNFGRNVNGVINVYGNHILKTPINKMLMKMGKRSSSVNLKGDNEEQKDWNIRLR